MTWDDDADDAGAAGSGPPLPPDDRLWRHPSELSGTVPGPLLPDVAALSQPPPGGRGTTWPVAITAGLAGAVLSIAILTLTGVAGTRTVERPVIEKVAVTPLVSSPIVTGDRGVAAVARHVAPSVARLVVRDAEGTAVATGVVFRDDGMVLTSAHAVGDATAITVWLQDGRSFDGTLVGADLTTDVAVVDIDADDLPVAVLGTSDALEAGASIITVGCPPSNGGPPTVATGIITALQGRIDDGPRSLHGLVQTDVSTAASTPGGALLDASGTVIGITTALGTGAADQLGFAVPIDLVRRVAAQLIAAGKAAHSWLGIEGADLTPDQASTLGLPGGAVVRSVAGDSPAHRAGLAPDDVITDVDGAPIDSSSSLVVEMREHPPGDEVVIGYWRDGRRQETTVVLSERT